MRKWLSPLMLLFCLCVSAQTLGDELLDPKVAFTLKVTAESPDRVVATWSIAKGYYLYRKSISVESLTAGIRVDGFQSPTGMIKDDRFFKKSQIYRDHVAVRIPLLRDLDSTTQVELALISQGCADIGVCFPPQRETVTVALPIPSETNLVAALGGTSNALFHQQPQDALLDSDQAFIPSVTAPDPRTVIATWTIAEGYYLYRDKLRISLVDAGGLQVKALDVPRGIPIEDEFFGRQEVFYDKAMATARLQGEWPSDGDLNIKLDYQGCAEIGVCYPPMSQIVPVTVALVDSTTSQPTTRDTKPLTDASEITPEIATPDAPPSPFVEAEQDRMARMLVEQRFWAIPAFFGFGLLLAFTPCVFPMIPILSSIIVGQGTSLTQRRAFMLSLVYVMAMAVTYTVAGVLAAMLGSNIQALFQNTWILAGFSALFVLLALSMFGLYELQLPNRWQSRLTEISNRQSGGTYLGVVVMGLLSALIVGPCVAPPLIGVLTVIAATGDMMLGGTILFVMSLGMGAPLLVIGSSAGRLLPRAGRWMDGVKSVFGVLLLAVAIWMLERILPAEVSMLLWATLLIVSATSPPPPPALSREMSAWHTLTKGLGIVLLVYGILLLVGVAAGSKDTLQPLRGVGLLADAGTTQEPLAFRPIKTVEDLQHELAQAAGRPVMLDFYADWCVSCKELEKYTFADPGVQDALAGAVLLQADVTANDAADQALLRRFGIIGPPAILFFGADGVEQQPYRVVGFMPADEFKTHVVRAIQL